MKLADILRAKPWRNGESGTLHDLEHHVELDWFGFDFKAALADGAVQVRDVLWQSYRGGMGRSVSVVSFNGKDIAVTMYGGRHSDENCAEYILDVDGWRAMVAHLSQWQAQGLPVQYPPEFDIPELYGEPLTVADFDMPEEMEPGK